MTKQEFIDIIKFEIEQKKGTMFDGILMAYEGVLELAEQLDEPKEFELVANDRNICSCCDFNLRDLIGEIVVGCDSHYCEGECDICRESVVHQITWTSKYMRYCPKCGAKIIKSEEKNNE